jgi:hypothetical protein
MSVRSCDSRRVAVVAGVGILKIWVGMILDVRFFFATGV